MCCLGTLLNRLVWIDGSMHKPVQAACEEALALFAERLIAATDNMQLTLSQRRLSASLKSIPRALKHDLYHRGKDKILPR